MPAFTLTDATKPENLLLKAISGSHAYGLATPSSDVDVRGIFMLPQDALFGMKYTEQVHDNKHDIVYYELRRFFSLALQNNPNILELLAVPEDCVKYRHPIMERLHVGMFLSKRCKNTFMGYAIQQISKAQGMNKKIVNPMDEKRKSILDFCFIAEKGKTIPLERWLDAHSMSQERCGLVKMDHMRNLYALYYDERDNLAFEGIMKKENSNDVSLSHVPKGEKPLAYLSFNRDGYSLYCKEYAQYWDWVKKRNDARYAQTEAHGKGYDAKNMMHCFRLLQMAEGIAREGIIQVRCENRDELLDIRAGKYEYAALKARAETRIKGLKEAFEQSALPDTPDDEAASRLLVDLRAEWYGSQG